MPIGRDRVVARQPAALFEAGPLGGLTDGQLLERFATQPREVAEWAFAALVERHGPMVLRVCRSALADPNDVQDAFQATFLVLVRKARGLWVRDSLAPWLSQVAYRTASRARSEAAIRRRHEHRAAELKAAGGADDGRGAGLDWEPILHEEIARLPERYRTPLVLCSLEGLTLEDVAQRLRRPVGTVKSRLAGARRRLRDRLARRGFAPGFGLIAARPGPDAHFPPTLVDSTTAAAFRFVATRAIVPGSAAALAQGVIRSMTIIRCLKAASVLLALGVAGSGAGLLAQDPKGGPGATPKPGPKVEAGRDADASVLPVKLGKLRLVVSERGAVETTSRSRDVLCRVEGGTTIISIKPEGTRVRKGELVAELDSAALKDALTNQKIAIRQAEADFKKASLAREFAEFALKGYVDGVLPRDREILKARLARAQSGLRRGEARRERTRLARKRLDEAMAPNKGPVTSQDILADLALDDRIDEAESDVSRLQSEVELAKGEQDVLEKYTKEKKTRQLTIDLERATAEEFSRRTAWGMEQNRVAKIEGQIEACRILAPVDGLLAHAEGPGRVGGPDQIQIEAGATVRERQLISRVIADDDPLRINIKVHESIVDRIKPGLRCLVRVDAAANEVIEGRVVRGAPKPDPNTRSNSGIKVYTTLVELEGGHARLNLRPGMTARVEILIAEIDDAISVPVTSVIRVDGEDRVAVKSPEGGIEWRDVDLGGSDLTNVEVKKGLRPGDLLILDPASSKSASPREKP